MFYGQQFAAVCAFRMNNNMLPCVHHGKKVANFKVSMVGGIGVAPIESEDDGFTARSAATYGITSHMVGIFCMRPPRHQLFFIIC